MVLFLQSWSEAAGLSSKSSSPKDKNFGAGWGHSCIGPGDRHPDPVYHPQPVWGLCCSYHRAPPQHHYGLHKVGHFTKPLNSGSQIILCGIHKHCSVCLRGPKQPHLPLDHCVKPSHFNREFHRTNDLNLLIKLVTQLSLNSASYIATLLKKLAELSLISPHY